MHQLMKQQKNHILISGKALRNKLNKTKLYFFYSSKTSQVITFISSFIVGLGDSSLNTQVICIE
jgi:hypothetical protein